MRKLSFFFLLLVTCIAAQAQSDLSAPILEIRHSYSPAIEDGDYPSHVSTASMASSRSPLETRRVLDSTNREFNVGNDSWIPIEKTQFEYAFESNRTTQDTKKQYLFYTVNPTTNSIDLARVTNEAYQLISEVDELDNITLEQYRNYSISDPEENPDFVPTSRAYSYGYEGDEVRRLVVTESVWEGGVFRLNSRDIRQYANADIQSRVVSNFDSTEALVNTEFWSYRYDGTGTFLAQTIARIQDAGSPDTVDFLRFDYFYDTATGEQIHRVASEWFPSGQAWLPRERYTTITQDGVFVEQLALWNTSDTSWVTVQTLGTRVGPIEDMRQRVDYFLPNTQGTQLINQVRDLNFFSERETTANPVALRGEGAAVQLYPNPSASYVTIGRDEDDTQYDVIRIFNTNGQVMLRQDIGREGVVDIRSLPTGAYYYTLLGKGTASASGKIMVQR